MELILCEALLFIVVRKRSNSEKRK